MADEDNRKLLEFAGFKEHHIPKIDWNTWIKPDEKEVLYPPNFFHPAHGLGWLFKYIVPKLGSDRKGYTPEITFYKSENKWGCFIENFRDYEVADEPQVALANAILKWLEGQGK
jgi:hypothetical protein